MSRASVHSQVTIPVTVIISSNGTLPDNSSVATVLELNPIEHLNLWLESLVAYHRESGLYLSSRQALPEDYNFREDLQGTSVLIQDIIQAMPSVVASSLQELPGSFSDLADRSDAEIRNLVRTHPVLRKELCQLLEFWEFLIRYQVIGNCLSKNARLTRSEFKAFTSLLAREISRYCSSPCHQTLLGRFHRSKIQYTILRDILLEIDLDGIREELERLFTQFFSLLRVVGFFQRAMSSGFQVHKFNILLVYSNYCCDRLLQCLDRAFEYLDYCQPDLAQGLAPVKFGLRVEFRRIFKRELRQVETESRLEERFSQIENAIGLLKQTAEEAFISLVHHFNPDFIAEDLFLDMRQRASDSARLRSDLRLIYRKIVELTTAPQDPDSAGLAQMLTEFRTGSMRALFYKDWQPFEKFGRDMETTEPADIPFLLHRFEVYVSTLLGEVSKRSVLTKAITYPNTGTLDR